MHPFTYYISALHSPPRDILHNGICCVAGCVENITTSDHKPVFSSFEVGITGQFITPDASHAHNENVKIIFDEIIAEVSLSGSHVIDAILYKN